MVEQRTRLTSIRHSLCRQIYPFFDRVHCRNDYSLIHLIRAKFPPVDYTPLRVSRIRIG